MILPVVSNFLPPLKYISCCSNHSTSSHCCQNFAFHFPSTISVADHVFTAEDGVAVAWTLTAPVGTLDQWCIPLGILQDGGPKRR